MVETKTGIYVQDIKIGIKTNKALYLSPLQACGTFKIKRRGTRKLQSNALLSMIYGRSLAIGISYNKLGLLC